MKGVTFDAGALIAIDRGDRKVMLLIADANKKRVRIAVPAGALAQAWRDGRIQARLARFLKTRIVEYVAFDAPTARAAGELCGRTATDDPIDASVVLCARKRGHAVVTSDPGDIQRLDPTLKLHAV